MTGTFIHPFAISRMPPMPDVNTDTLVDQPDHHPVRRTSVDVAPANGSFSVWNISTFDRVQQGEPEDDDQRHPHRPGRVGAVAAADVQEQPVAEPPPHFVHGRVPRRGFAPAAGSP